MLFPMFGLVGIAIATSLSGWTNAILLSTTLMRRGHFRFDASLAKRLPLLVLASALWAAALYGANLGLARYFEHGYSTAIHVAALGALVSAGIVAFAVARPNHRRDAAFHAAPRLLPRLTFEATVDGIAIAQAATWSIAAIATGGVILRPWGLPEAVWAVAGAAALVLSTLLPWRDALAATAKGTDVYLFLTGMMLLADLARREGLFDWVAAHAATAAKGSPARLFALVYLAGIAVTVFLSNDATAVVLTPAVYAAARAAKAEPLPYLVICAFIANAASFVLPISNPANLVLYGHEMPALWPWLKQFALPSALSIAATYAGLRWVFRHDLGAKSTDMFPHLRFLREAGTLPMGLPPPWLR